MRVPAWAKLSRKELIASGIAGSIATTLITGIIYPIFTVITDKVFSTFQSKTSEVIVQACAPLKSSREIVSFHSPTKGLQVLEDFERHLGNETFVYVENKSGKDLKDAFLSIYPVSVTGEEAELYAAELLFTAIHRSSSYKYEYDKIHHTMGITLPILGNSDSILVDQLFNVPVGFIVELSADGFNARRIFQPGCPNRISVNDVLERAANPYIGDNCKAATNQDLNSINSISCAWTDHPEKPIEVTEEMRGKQLKITDYSDVDPTRVSIKHLRTNVLPHNKR